MRQPIQHRLDWHRHLLFDFLGSAARVERNHVDLDIRDIRKSLDGQIVEGGPTAGNEQKRHQYDKERLMERKRNNAPNHCRSCCSSTQPSVTTRCPALSPAMMAICSCCSGPTWTSCRAKCPGCSSTNT